MSIGYAVDETPPGSLRRFLAQRLPPPGSRPNASSLSAVFRAAVFRAADDRRARDWCQGVFGAPDGKRQRDGSPEILARRGPKRFRPDESAGFNQLRMNRMGTGKGNNACAPSALMVALARAKKESLPRTVKVDECYRNVSNDYEDNEVSSPHRMIQFLKAQGATDVHIVESRTRIAGIHIFSRFRHFPRWCRYRMENRSAGVTVVHKRLTPGDFPEGKPFVFVTVPIYAQDMQHCVTIERRGSRYMIMDPGQDDGRWTEFANFERWAGLKGGWRSWFSALVPLVDRKYGCFTGICIPVTA